MNSALSVYLFVCFQHHSYICISDISYDLHSAKQEITYYNLDEESNYNEVYFGSLYIWNFLTASTCKKSEWFHRQDQLITFSFNLLRKILLMAKMYWMGHFVIQSQHFHFLENCSLGFFQTVWFFKGNSYCVQNVKN